MIPLHGIGGRQDLPLPFGMVVAGAALALVATFVLLAVTSTSRAGEEGGRGRLLPTSLTRFVDSPVCRWSVRVVGLGISLFMAAALLFGPDQLTNPIFGFVYVCVWVGLVPVSLLLGPIWITLNPFRTLHLIICRIVGTGPAHGLLIPSLGSRIGIWPAVAGLVSFVWLELIAPDRTTIPVLMLWVAIYSVVMLLGTVLFGRGWIAVADPFEVYATIVAKLSPWARDANGRIVARSPLTNLRTLKMRPGLITFLAVLLGSTAFDGFSNTTILYRWTAESAIPGILLATFALAGFIALVRASYTAASGLTGHLLEHRAGPSGFAHTLVPIVLGYMAAHYLTLLLFEGQRVLINVSDPLGLGWDLLGTAELSVNTTFANYPGLIGCLQVAAIVAGHILGTVAAHRRAITLSPPPAASGQLPLLVVMVGYTVGGLLLLFAE